MKRHLCGYGRKRRTDRRTYYTYIGIETGIVFSSRWKPSLWPTGKCITTMTHNTYFFLMRKLISNYRNRTAWVSSLYLTYTPFCPQNWFGKCLLTKKSVFYRDVSFEEMASCLRLYLDVRILLCVIRYAH